MKCHACGNEAMRVERLPEFETELYGLPLVLKNAVTEITCENCGEVRHRLPQDRENMIEKTLAFARLHIPVILSGAEIRFLRNTLGMDQEAFCTQIMPGSKIATLSRWENDKQRPGGFAELVMRTNVAALIAEDVPGMSYDPKFTVGMKLYDREIGRIELEQVKVRFDDEVHEVWARAA